MGGTKISSGQKKELKSQNLILNISLLILIIIVAFLSYTTFTNISFMFDNNDEELLTEIQNAKIQVEVLNGCGVTGVADRLTEYLREKKVDVVNLGNYRSFEIENSIIISRNEKMKRAEQIALLVGLDENNIIQQTNPDYLLDVTFILGKDYRNLIPLKTR